MATGISKTKWQWEKPEMINLQLPNLGVSLQYEGKQPEGEILSYTFPSPLLLWSDDQMSANQLYYGDNLAILSTLYHQHSLRGKVQLIYIDPPFATNSVFQSRTQADAYQDLLKGGHYIEFIRKRLVFLKELLAEDGSIYVHLDDNMVFYIKVIMDEIFGSQNFRNCITRRKCSHKNYTKKTYGNISDYILFYTKSDKFIWNRPVEEWTTERAKKEYPCVEEKTGRRYKKVPIHAPGIRNGETGKPWRNKLPPPGKHWQYPPQTLDEMDTRGEIYWSPSGNPRRKIYLDDSAGVPVQDIWYDFRDTHNQNALITGYPTEKNPDLLKRIILASSNPGDLVLDCFSGSGTTLTVAHQLNRQWIGVDNSAEAIKTTLYRFVKGAERMGDFINRPGDDFSISQTSLFDLLEPVKIHRSAQTPIKQFSVYAIKENMSIANDIIAEWQTL